MPSQLIIRHRNKQIWVSQLRRLSQESQKLVFKTKAKHNRRHHGAEIRARVRFHSNNQTRGRWE